ncbi:glycosyltransferase involved in cell wall biosynthesis [Humitalea rosea]|uniref:Glycosyltransferase involved in cell wall biosynthesis n=1 Tax=Humitalea rosea TaxID=990373 RepID=A0A2W7I4Q3_9PROT|nr:glycosyltransferase family 1 protein [Humitalea rosea]PZW41861.1 glycosyltransferase involved in cell wall biosynthesis [Humitalea rosea]
MALIGNTAEPVRVILDVSRLLSSGDRKAPSGIDRVELAYARHFLETQERSVFVAQDLIGRFGILPRPLVAALVATLENVWTNTPTASATRRVRGLMLSLRARAMAGLGLSALRTMLARPGRKAFLLVSHRALEDGKPIEVLRDAGCAFVPLIHDLIPATHPEYARPKQPARHLRRIGTTAALADAVIVNSAATAACLVPHLTLRGAPPPVLVAPLGIVLPEVPVPPISLDPYFVTLGTIEPRKNHLLLLNLWREFAATLGPRAPRLLVIGRRGWENENVLDMLERCTGLRGLVQEVGQVSDRTVAELLRGARALLFPSFAEGYGLPLAEALSLRVPAICSDLPALREVGGNSPDYLDPLDGLGWRRAVLDYARLNSPARAAQVERLQSWRVPSWADHFAKVDALLARVVPQSRRTVLVAGKVEVRGIPVAHASRTSITARIDEPTS